MSGGDRPPDGNSLSRCCPSQHSGPCMSLLSLILSHYFYRWSSLFTQITCVVCEHGLGHFQCGLEIRNGDILSWWYLRPSVKSHEGEVVTSRIVSPTQGVCIGIHGRGPENLYFVIYSECLEQVHLPAHDVIR